jgi:hypothetical protein
MAQAISVISIRHNCYSAGALPYSSPRKPAIHSAVLLKPPKV